MALICVPGLIQGANTTGWREGVVVTTMSASQAALDLVQTSNWSPFNEEALCINFSESSGVSPQTFTRSTGITTCNASIGAGPACRNPPTPRRVNRSGPKRGPRCRQPRRS